MLLENIDPNCETFNFFVLLRSDLDSNLEIFSMSDATITITQPKKISRCQI